MERERINESKIERESKRERGEKDRESVNECMRKKMLQTVARERNSTSVSLPALSMNFKFIA